MSDGYEKPTRAIRDALRRHAEIGPKHLREPPVKEGEADKGEETIAGKPGRNAKGQFEKGRSGNPSGRPPARRWLPTPNQLARDVVALSMQKVTVPGPNGPRQMYKGELVAEAIFASAVKGKAAAQKRWLDQMEKGIAELLDRVPGVALAELMRQMHEDPNENDPPGLMAAVDEWRKRIKRLR